MARPVVPPLLETGATRRSSAAHDVCPKTKAAAGTYEATGDQRVVPAVGEGSRRRAHRGAGTARDGARGSENRNAGGHSQRARPRPHGRGTVPANHGIDEEG